MKNTSFPSACDKIKSLNLTFAQLRADHKVIYDIW
jgi:hypothetical protein